MIGLTNGLALVPLSPTIPLHRTTPDLVLHSPHLMRCDSFQVSTSEVNSDHTPIFVDLDVEFVVEPSVPLPPKRTWLRHKFTESHWTSFTERLEAHCTRLSMIRSLNKLCCSFVKTVESVAIQTLPNKWVAPGLSRGRRRRRVNPELLLLEGCTKGVKWTYRKFREMKGDCQGISTPKASLEDLQSKFFPAADDDVVPVIPTSKDADVLAPS
eukprot:TRINITY_DN11781_c0_g1_i1.p1 TRINITY_DN11781_c0_g1~~TRINITY_DN11781_c0_g1_i1.p1  ORF type:complete len:212 (+),score=2.87 TRINITY_DN11781_c0_g1_i1:5-640(+)